MRRPFSLAGKLSVLLLLPIAAAGVAAAVVSALDAPPLVVFLSVAAAAALVLPICVSRFLQPSRAILAALSDGTRAIRSHDFSLRLAVERRDELGELAAVYNTLVDELGRERRDLRQRELLLETVLDTSPTAVLLITVGDRISYANRAARRLFASGRRLEGHALTELLAISPEPLRQALENGRDSVVSLPHGDEIETLHVTRHSFVLNTQPQQVLTVAPLTHQMRRQEILVWKRVIRTISHELRNSLAPIRSLVHSARLVRRKELDPSRLDDALEQIDQSAAALSRFVEGYARFARLPEPRLEAVELRSFLEHLNGVEPFVLDGQAPARTVEMDPGQIQQVLVNLLHNAREAGSSPEEVVVRTEELADGSLVLEVLDRGPGMDEQAMSRALVPFYSSKRDGTGLGLPISREILEAHGGELSLCNRDGGGLAVRCRLPAGA